MVLPPPHPAGATNMGAETIGDIVGVETTFEPQQLVVLNTGAVFVPQQFDNRGVGQGEVTG
ncbi:MAG: hypothetical protein AAF939_06380 [Planctomycetota bacterium]